MISIIAPEPETPCYGMKKRVSWKGAFVREYNVTMGDHPMCSDSLPVSLDWSHSDEVTFKNIDESRERNSKYAFPKRLSYEDRRRRVFGEGDAHCEGEMLRYWVQSTNSAGKEAHETSLMDLDHTIEQIEKEVYGEIEATKQVVYCRHAKGDEDDENDDDDYSFFLNFSQFGSV